jgi:hypothetical protein
MDPADGTAGGHGEGGDGLGRGEHLRVERGVVIAATGA